MVTSNIGMIRSRKGQAGWVILIVVVILLVIGIWGLVGANEAKKVGTTCDVGMGTSLCWSWHRNLVGQTQDFLGKLGSG